MSDHLPPRDMYRESRRLNNNKIASAQKERKRVRSFIIGDARRVEVSYKTALSLRQCTIEQNLMVCLKIHTQKDP